MIVNTVQGKSSSGCSQVAVVNFIDSVQMKQVLKNILAVGDIFNINLFYEDVSSTIS